MFQHLTYRHEPHLYDFRRIPALFVMTSNAPVAYYEQAGYGAMVARYEGFLEEAVGPTKTLIVGETMQVKNYDCFDWDIFDAEARRERHDTVFPDELQRAFRLGAEMVSNPW